MMSISKLAIGVLSALLPFEGSFLMHAAAQDAIASAVVTDEGIPISDIKIFRTRATFNGGNCATPAGWHRTHYSCHVGYSIPVTPGKSIQVIGGFPNNVTGAGSISSVMTHMAFTGTGMDVALARDWTRFDPNVGNWQWIDPAFSYEVDFIVLAVIR
jgi:hypothetical protein